MQTDSHLDTSASQRLPTELVTDILEYLPQSDLRSAASASRDFYRAAQVAGRCIRRTIDFRDLREGQRALSIFKLVVQHALGKPPSDRPGIALRLVCTGTSNGCTDFTRAFEDLLQSFEQSLSLLVGLEVYLQPVLCSALYGAMQEPAPRLRYLALGHGDARAGRPAAPPQNLFQGNARRLRTLCLVLPVWDPEWRSIRAFQRVTNLRLVLYNTGPPIRISRFSWGLRSLAVHLSCTTLQREQDLDLSGADLHDLALADGQFARLNVSGIDLCRVPVVERVSDALFDSGDWDEDADAPLCARIASVRPWAAGASFLSAVSFANGGWTRTAFANRTPSPILAPIATIPGTAARLSALMLDYTLLVPFLRCKATLAALTELYVDFTIPQPLECRPCDLSGLAIKDVHLECPSLRSVVLVSFVRRMELRAENVAMLGQMLKQHARPDGMRAALKLAGVGFVQPAARGRVRRIFSCVSESETFEPKALGILDACASRVQNLFWVPDFSHR